MQEPKLEIDNADELDQQDFSVDRVAKPLLAIVIVTAVLYLGREILLPITMASILAIIFSPVASRLEPYFGRLLTAFLVLIVSVAVVSGLIYFLTVELTSVAVDVAGYSDNIAAKVNALKGQTPLWLQRVEGGIAEVEQQIDTKSTPMRARKTTVIQAAPATLSPDVSEVLKPVMPVLASVADGLLVLTLLFFLLYGRSDLRDRFVRLAARGRITIASQAIETAVDTVAHYLLLFSITNLAFGVMIGLVVWWLGLPNPVFWGGLAFLLRYIPYVGALISGVLPTLVAFAVFPGWHKSLELLGAFILFDQIATQVAEPFLIGRGIGLSPVALLIAAMYWSWLWGIAGLLLAAPLTACLKVAGEYIPPLGFLAILLGIGDASEDYREYYRRLLELDQSGARGLAIRYCDENGLEGTFDDIIAPALALMGEERAEDHISAECQQFIAETSLQIVIELGNRLSRPRNATRVRVLGITTSGDPHSIELLLLLELMRQDGAAAIFAGENKSVDDIRRLLRRFDPTTVCISCTIVECLPATLELIRSIRQETPRARIIAGGKAAVDRIADFLAAGCAQVYFNRNEARHAVRRYGGASRAGYQRAISEVPGGSNATLSAEGSRSFREQ
jgi:predicted PurR-regulated permease PerM/methylmalonyl-CoA mutase cobalamin-binding subunit